MTSCKPNIDEIGPLTLINAALFITIYRRGGGANQINPKIRVSGKSWQDPKIQAIIRQQEKKWGQSPQNWARTVESKFQPKCRKSRFREIREFSRILTSSTKTALARSFLAQFTSFLLHMHTDRLFQVLGEKIWNEVLDLL